jgi:protein required for attachment to host cells
MKKTMTWILVSDGARARVYKNEGPGKGLSEALDHEFAMPHPPTRALGSDRPGRSHPSVGGSRHGIEPRADWHEQEKEIFVKEVAKVLDGAAIRNAFDRLVLVAPPKALGALRGALSDQTRDRVSAELAKDLTHVSVHELPDRLTTVMRL